MSGYEDIIDHPHYQSKKRPHMSMQDRAAQFSPFAALVGFDAAVEETGRLTEEKIILDEDKIQIINSVVKSLSRGDMVQITYFLPDELKSGGMYLPVAGSIKKVDPVENILYLTDGTEIAVGDILEIEKTNGGADFGN